MISSRNRRDALQPAPRHGRGRADDRRAVSRFISPANVSAQASHDQELSMVYIAERMLKEWAVTVAEDDSGIVSFHGRRGEEVGHFYTRPDRIGCGAETQLIEAAETSDVAALELWCFQANTRALRFYEARGFQAIRFTDGANNEERTP